MGLLRKPDKASLRNILLSDTTTKTVQRRVIDGCALLHRIHWPKNCNFGQLFKHYAQSVRTSYGICSSVFDGYETVSTKDQEHLRRSTKSRSVEIKFDKETKVQSKREDFLSNSQNKTAFIKQLAAYLIADGHDVYLSRSDADTDIVKVAIEVIYHFQYSH